MMFVQVVFKFKKIVVYWYKTKVASIKFMVMFYNAVYENNHLQTNKDLKW